MPDETMGRLNEAIEAIGARSTLEPRVGIILGTGLGGLASELEVEVALPYGDLPHFPVPTVESHEGRPIGVALPDQVTLEIVEADPVVKGQTAASSYKPAKLENGVRVMVPPFIEAGEKIVVDTNELTYVRRAES